MWISYRKCNLSVTESSRAFFRELFSIWSLFCQWICLNNVVGNSTKGSSHNELLTSLLFVWTSAPPALLNNVFHTEVLENHFPVLSTGSNVEKKHCYVDLCRPEDCTTEPILHKENINHCCCQKKEKKRKRNLTKYNQYKSNIKVRDTNLWNIQYIFFPFHLKM